MDDKSPKHELKLLVIGLDGATWEVIKPMVARGELPYLRQLMEDGSHGDLQSTMPPFSPPAWATFMTGLNPGKHGIFGFVNFNPQSYSQIESRLVTAAPLVGRTTFDLLSHFNYRLASISVPITYPAWPINGYMVSGEPCPDNQKQLVYPESFANSLTRHYAFPSTLWSKSNDEIIKGLYEMDKSRTELAIQLILEKDLDALFVVLGATDRVQHNFWRFYDKKYGSFLGLPHAKKYESVIAETYQRADESVGRILSQVGDNTLVFVISDHGGGAAATNFFHTNAWLLERGYLQIIQGRDSLVRHSRGTALALRRFLDTPLGSQVRSLLPAQFIKQGRMLIRNISQIDWSRTCAYRFPMYPPAEGIVVNLVGRQPQGIVQPGSEYERLRQEIVDQVLRFVDPETGEHLVEQAYTREQLYNGPYIERAPDIVLALKEDFTGGTRLQLPLVSNVNPETLKKVNGEHRMQGILLAYGPMIKNNHIIQGARLVDMAPTLLYSLGLPVIQDMDGAVLKDLFTPEFIEANPERKASVLEMIEYHDTDLILTPEEQEQIEIQLKRLGYL